MLLQDTDPEIFDAITKESTRQLNNINLIASENYASKAVLTAQGSIFTNKYAEGYPGRRYYGGCEFVDVVEQTAIDRAKSLYECEYVNVQPHSGAQANMAAYFATLEPKDVVMGMSLNHGGHLTHGSSVNFSAKIYNFISYGLNPDTETIDFDDLEQKAKTYSPKLIVAGASAYSQIIDFKKFKEIADLVGAKLMVDMAHISGLVAGKVHPSPVEFADIVTSTTHKTLRGPRGGMILAKKELSKGLNSAVFPNMQGGPLEHVIAAKAVAFKEAQSPDFKKYQVQIIKNAKALAKTLLEGGLRLVSGGTENHLVLVDLTPMNLSGKQAEEALGKANIVINRNAIPFDKKPPREASGMRLGTPSITSRGMIEEDCEAIGKFILKVLENPSNEKIISDIQNEIIEFTNSFPVPGINQ
ncbi:MAG: serine hydroxymethyltransferase [SAR202 cluster bacterium]|nr:serine hydroxymethyltransferase [SAR202 cluster bacterium]